MKPILGNYHELALWNDSQCPRPLSFLDPRWRELQDWKVRARAKVWELLSYNPPFRALDATAGRILEQEDVILERVSYAQPFGPRTEGFLLRPSKQAGRIPGVIALHDHGGFKYFGKEKLVALADEPRILKDFRQECYEGVPWATALARRGYVVFVPDVFLWGSRRMPAESVPEEFTARVLRETPGTDEYIRAYNDFASDYETLVAKTLFLSGTTWPGIMAWDDRRALDYLVTRPEVDPERLACGGLSGGGLRTVYFAGLDERIRCAFCVGFMSVNREVLAAKITSHTWMYHVPHLAAFMDLPDVISMHGPAPLMVQYDREDDLWTLAGQEQAHEKLAAIYEKMGAAGSYQGLFYPGPHKFDRAMQEDAFTWLDRWLR
jgi:dienelactone hydrolase